MSTLEPGPAGAVPSVPSTEYQLAIDALDREIVSLAARMNACEYRLLVMIREFDERGGWLKWGLSNCPEWLHYRCDMSLSTAREKVRVAHALKGLAEVSAAFETGRLSYSKVRALTRVAAADNEETLVAFALSTTAARVEERCRQMRNVEPSSVDDANRAHGRRGLSVWRDEAHGTMRLTVELPIEQGALIEQALDKAVEATSVEGPEFAGTSWHSQRADGFVEIARAYLSPRRPAGDGIGDRAGGDAGTLDDAAGSAAAVAAPAGRAGGPADGAAVRADGAADPARDAAGNGARDAAAASARRAGVAADHYQVVIHVDRSALVEGAGRSDLPIESVRRLTCDGSLIAMLDGPDGEPLSVGRKTRTLSTAIRRALWARDKGCAFPGCTHTRFVEAHHVEHWAGGGETSADNTMLLCWPHHRLVHEGGYTIDKDCRDKWFFRRPDGRAVPDCGYSAVDVTDDPVDDDCDADTYVGIDEIHGGHGHPSADAWLANGDAAGDGEAFDAGTADAAARRRPSADASMHANGAPTRASEIREAQGVYRARYRPSADSISMTYRRCGGIVAALTSRSPSSPSVTHRRAG